MSQIDQLVHDLFLSNYFFNRGSLLHVNKLIEIYNKLRLESSFNS